MVFDERDGGTFFGFSDPDGNTWAVQELKVRGEKPLIPRRPSRPVRRGRWMPDAGHVVPLDELEHSAHSHEFVGAEHGDVPFSIILVHSQPGVGPKLHRHPYAEVFVVETGQATFRIGDRTLVVDGRARRREPARRGARLHEHGRGRAPARRRSTAPRGSTPNGWKAPTRSGALDRGTPNAAELICKLAAFFVEEQTARSRRDGRSKPGPAALPAERPSPRQPFLVTRFAPDAPVETDAWARRSASPGDSRALRRVDGRSSEEPGRHLFLCEERAAARGPPRLGPSACHRRSGTTMSSRRRGAAGTTPMTSVTPRSRCP